MAEELLTKTFSYKAIGSDGIRKKGKMDAVTQSEVLDTLKAEGMVPISIAVASQSVWNVNITRAKTDNDLKIKQDELLVLTRQLHLLLRAGLSIHRAVLVLSEDHGNQVYVRMCQDISQRVLSGTPLSKAMALYPRVFNEVYCAYVAAGEATGDIERSMFRLAKVLEQQHSLRLKVRAVTAYPKMVSIAISILIYGILSFLVPMYARIYEGFGQPLPGPTQFLVKLSSQLSPFHIKFKFAPPSIDLIPEGRNLLTAPINFLSPVAFRRKTEDDLDIGARVDKIKFRVPMLGSLWKQSVLYRWSSTMSGSLAAGLQTYSALEIAGNTSGSKWIQLATLDLKEAVRSGRSLAAEMQKHPGLFSPQIRAMAATGEEAGEAAEMFGNVAYSLEDELDAMVATLGARLEVALLLMMGAVVGALLVVLYMPILNLTKVAGDGYSQ